MNRQTGSVALIGPGDDIHFIIAAHFYQCHIFSPLDGKQLYVVNTPTPTDGLNFPLKVKGKHAVNLV